MEINSFQLLALEYSLVLSGIFLTYKCFALRKNNMDHFWRFIISLDIMLLVNVPIRYIELEYVKWNRELIYTLYSISIVYMTFTMFYWFIFVMKQINSSLALSTLKYHLCMIPAMLMIPLCIVNRFTGWMFYIDSDSCYHRGSIFVLQSAVSYMYFLFIIIVESVHYWKGTEKIAAKKCGMAALPALLGSAMQIFYGGSYLLAGCVIGAMVMYVEVCLDRQKAYEVADAISDLSDQLSNSNAELAENMNTIVALAGVYHVIYDVDLVNDTFKEVKVQKEISAFCSQFKSARECLENVGNSMFIRLDQPTVSSFFDLTTVDRRLSNVDSCFVDARGTMNGRWLRSSFTVTERDNNGNVIRLVYTLQDVNDFKLQQIKSEEASLFEEHANEMKELFEQTAEALSGAIDAKDTYTHGHSERVATYSRQIAEMAGLSDEECEEVYFAGLLHDVGKIGIDDSIINKNGKLTDEEYAEIKMHPVYGKEILSRITKLPYLSIGANYHHERYDGHGYPEGLKGDDIPRIARIIAVADAYDAMTSKRSYRDPLPQQIVREEIIKGMDNQFDPEYASLMLQMIDHDLEYNMREKDETIEKIDDDEIRSVEFGSEYSEGILITEYPSTVRMRVEAIDSDKGFMPEFVLYDSLDSHVHTKEREVKDLLYFEYCKLLGDGTYECEGARNIKVDVNDLPEAAKPSEVKMYELRLVREKDHIQVTMYDGARETDTIIALPDSTKFAYMAITGENAHIYYIDADRANEPIKPGTIERIAEEISFIDGPEGDMPNIQIDGWRTDTSEGIDINRDMKITYHMKSLPFARLVWHCSFIVIYSSDDGKVNGVNYREYCLVRYDGEQWQEDAQAENKTIVTKNTDFIDWENWKHENKEGRDIELDVYKEGKTITIKTTNGGIELCNVTTVTAPVSNIYLSITGDQCVVENIKVRDLDA